MKLKVPIALVLAALVLAPVFLTGASTIRSGAQIFIPADNSVDSTKIADGSIVEADLSAGCVTQAKLAQDAVGQWQIGEDSVTAVEIAAGACDSAEIATGAVYPQHLGETLDSTSITDGGIGSADIGTGRITRAHILDGTVRYDDLDNYERGQLGLTPVGDTLFTEWFDDGSGTGYALVRVDELGDSLAFFRYCYQAKTGANRGWGGMAAGTGADAATFLCTDIEYVAPIRSSNLHRFWDASAAGDAMTHVDTVKTIHTNDCIQYQDSWTYLRGIAVEDTCYLEIERTLTMWRNMPGVVVRYRMRSDEPGVGGDTLRFIWVDDICLGGGSLDCAPEIDLTDGLRFDTGWFPGYGEVRRDHCFDDFPVPVAAMLNIGNVKATIDTVCDGTSAYLSESLKYDLGSGTEQFVGTWVAFNPNGVRIEQIAFQDTTEAWGRLCYDSTFTVWDTTSVFGHLASAQRTVYFRSEPLYLDTVNWVEIEWAIGPVTFLADTSPIQIAIPEIRWTDGTVTKVDTGLRR